MKKIYFLALLAVTSLAFTSCGDDDDDNTATSKTITLPTPQFKDDAVKLEVLSAPEINLNGRQVKLKKIEITESGKYLLSYEDVEKSRTRAGNPLLDYFMGLVKKNSDGSYELVGFASIYISINGQSYHVTLIPTGSEQIDVDVRKLDNIASDDLTGYLCRTWTVENTRVRGTIDGVKVAKDFPGECNVNELVEYAQSKGANITDQLKPNKIVQGITFTTSGTYLINYKNASYDVGTWWWTSKQTGGGSVSYDWEQEAMGSSLESGTASIDFVEGTKCKLTLQANITNATVELVYTLH